MNCHKSDAIRNVERGDKPSPLKGPIRALIGQRISDLRARVRRAGLVLRGRASRYRVKQRANQIEVADPKPWGSGPDTAGEGVAAGPGA